MKKVIFQKFLTNTCLPLNLSQCLVNVHLRVPIERVLRETFLWRVTFRPKMGMVKARNLGLRSKKYSSKIVQDYGNI